MFRDYLDHMRDLTMVSPTRRAYNELLKNPRRLRRVRKLALTGLKL